MRNLLIYLLFIGLSTSFQAQWTPVESQNINSTYNEAQLQPRFQLNTEVLKLKLKNLNPFEKSNQLAVIEIPSLDGRIERFSVYTAPVVVASLAKRYDLQSYAGRGIDDPNKRIRFSLSGNKFQLMMYKNSAYHFIEVVDEVNSIYQVSPKANKTSSGRAFECSTNENIAKQNQLNKIFSTKKINSTQSSDKIFRTLRLAMSTTGEYTKYFGGVPQALVAINATLTTVNGIYEKDLGLELILQNFPQLIYTDPATDPYSDASIGVKNQQWGKELQNNLTSSIGNAAYDIGHLFGATGGAGDGGCIGCVCTDNTIKDALNKGSGFTSPSDGIPRGNNFDVDYVAHEMGHQLGAVHIFSHVLEDEKSNIEPGSGSSIMGYAGITTSDVQAHSDPYFNSLNISQIQNNLLTVSCDVENPVANNPPVISPLPAYTIPKSTAFVLDAQVSDTEADPLTYNWEQVDNATPKGVTTINSTNLYGPMFRSVPPSSETKRYFPRLASVMNGTLTDTKNWETVADMAREMNFRVTVRDNHPNVKAQQTTYNSQKIKVTNDGPFKINLSKNANFYAGIYNTITWDVVNTAAAPYNSPQVNISYTTDGGVTWTTAATATSNDGKEDILIPNSLLGSTSLQFRIESIGNVFYAVSPTINVLDENTCVATTPTVSSVVPSFTETTITWNLQPNIYYYTVEYRQIGTNTYTSLTTTNNRIVLTSLTEGTTYEYRIKSHCPKTESSYTTIDSFTTLSNGNCTSTSTKANDEYMANVEIERYSNTALKNYPYIDYGLENFRTIYLNKNMQNYSLRLTPKWLKSKFPVSISVWIDYDGNKSLSNSEQIFMIENTLENQFIQEFSIPNHATIDPRGVRMRVSLKRGSLAPTACEKFDYGAVQDYKIVFDNNAVDKSEIKVLNSVIDRDTLATLNVPNGTVYELYDPAGRMVRSGQIQLNKIDFSNLNTGAYVLKIAKKAFKILKK